MVNLKDFPCNNRALVWVGNINFRYLNGRDSETLREFSQPENSKGSGNLPV